MTFGVPGCKEAPPFSCLANVCTGTIPGLCRFPIKATS
jgi:hypothetical protein